MFHVNFSASSPRADLLSSLKGMTENAENSPAAAMHAVQFQISELYSELIDWTTNPFYQEPGNEKTPEEVAALKVQIMDLYLANRVDLNRVQLQNRQLVALALGLIEGEPLSALEYDQAWNGA